LTTWFEPFMPKFDYIHSKAALDSMTNNAIWWIKETNADGFRHDAVKHIPNIFWRTLTKKLKKEIEIPENKMVYQIGETFGSYKLVESYVNNGQLNAQFNFNLYDTAIPTFIQDDQSFKALDEQMQKTFAVYGMNHLMGNIMDSHDKVRFLAYADNDVPLGSSKADSIGWFDPPHVDHPSSYKKEKLYLAYLLTIPGVPIIDYGDEFGMTGASDPDNRRMMRFGNQLDNNEKENLEEVKKLIHLRDDHSALRYGDYYSLNADTNIFAYLRSDMNESVLVVLNKNPEAQNVDLEFPAFYKSNYIIDLFTGEKIKLNGNKADIPVKGIGYRFFSLRHN
ncbi:MAG: alpha-amylase family glycosyl hydrolase, partial [Ignavibacteriaceae bacterium]